MKCIALEGRPLEPVNLIDCREDMNDPEVTMNDTPSNSNLIVYRKALELFDEVRAIMWRLLNPRS